MQYNKQVENNQPTVEMPRQLYSQMKINEDMNIKKKKKKLK